ncbi:hypothetical protein FRC10_002453, partial [Ceratobasidium sp. 414]
DSSSRSTLQTGHPHPGQSPVIPKTSAKRAGRLSLENQHDCPKKPKHRMGHISAGTIIPSLPSSAAQNDQPLPLSELWRTTTAKFFKRIEVHRQTSHIPADTIGELLSLHRIGGAYIHAFGTGHLSAVLDPLLRRNPRPIDKRHLAKLVKIFLTPGAKRDHHTPIILMVPRGSVDPECVTNMSSADPHDPLSLVPRLCLVNPDSQEILSLEACVITNQECGHWLAETVLQQKIARLKILYERSQKAVLLNGHHRVQAIIQIGRMLMGSFYKLQSLVRAGNLSEADMELELGDAGFTGTSALASYRVEVYDSDTISEELIHYLVRNQEGRDTKGMGAAEAAWWLAQKFDISIQNSTEQGMTTRGALIDAAFTNGGFAAFAGPSSARDLIPEHAPETSGQPPVALAGFADVARFFTSPLTMEMVRDTRDAFAAYDHCLKATHAATMLQDPGALLCSRFWLAARTLLQIFTVESSPTLTDAHRYIDETPALNTLGDGVAAEHYQRLLSDRQTQRTFIQNYTPEVSKQFDALYCAALDRLKHPKHEFQWDHDHTVLSIRKVFDEFGVWVLGNTFDWSFRVGVALRLYARLPLIDDFSSCSNPYFTSTSALPALGWLEREHSYRLETQFPAGLNILEYAINPNLPMWTIGAQPAGELENRLNWYSRSHALHQIALQRLNFNSPEMITSNLHQNRPAHTFWQSILALTDFRLHRAIQRVSVECGDRLADLQINCCTGRSSGNSYKVLNDYRQEFEREFGSFSVGVTKFHEARKALKDHICGQPDRFDIPLLGFPDRYPVLSIVTSRTFWADPKVLSWIFGWNTSPVRRFQDVNSALGWALMGKRMEPLFEELMDQSPESRYILKLAQDLALESGLVPWWITEGIPLPLSGSSSSPGSDPGESNADSSSSSSPRPQSVEEFEPPSPDAAFISYFGASRLASPAEDLLAYDVVDSTGVAAPVCESHGQPTGQSALACADAKPRPSSSQYEILRDAGADPFDHGPALPIAAASLRDHCN